MVFQCSHSVSICFIALKTDLQSKIPVRNRLTYGCFNVQYNFKLKLDQLPVFSEKLTREHLFCIVLQALL